MFSWVADGANADVQSYRVIGTSQHAHTQRVELKHDESVTGAADDGVEYGIGDERAAELAHGERHGPLRWQRADERRRKPAAFGDRRMRRGALGLEGGAKLQQQVL